MHNKAHVRSRAQAQAETQLTGADRARTGFRGDPADRPGGARRALGSFAERPAGNAWERRFAAPTLTTCTRGEAAARRLDRCN